MQDSPQRRGPSLSFSRALRTDCVLLVYIVLAVLDALYMGVASAGSPSCLPAILPAHGFDLYLGTLLLVVAGCWPLLMGLAVAALTYLFLESTRMRVLGGCASAATIVPIYAVWHYLDVLTPGRTWPWSDPVLAFGFYMVYVVVPAIVLAVGIRWGRARPLGRLGERGD